MEKQTASEPSKLNMGDLESLTGLETTAKSLVTQEQAAYLKNLGIPEMYLSARLADFEEDVSSLVNRSINDGPGYYLTGPCGTGKTHLAVAILIKWMNSKRASRIVGDRWNTDLGKAVPRWEHSAGFTTIPQMLADIRGAFGTESGSVSQIIQRLVKTRGQVFDDLGSERATDWAGETIYDVISRRINALLPTIVTSNLSLDEIHNKDPRLASRLGGLHVIRLAGCDRRLRRKQIKTEASA